MTALIAGGGVAGLTLALALGRRGLVSTLFERAARLDEVGAGVQLSPNAGRALAALGLDEALDAVATRPQAVVIRDAVTGRLLKRLTLGAQAERRWGAPYRVVHRADLQAILFKALRAVGSCEIRLASELRGVRATENGVEIDVADASGEAAFAGDWLAGCDGLRSVARGAIGLPTDVGASQLKAWRATVTADTAPAAFDPKSVGVWLGPGAHLVVYPVRRGREANIVLIGGGKAEAPLALTGRWAPAAQAFARLEAAWTPWPLHDRAPDSRMQRDRIALVGDAAHAALPSLAQGAGFAIEDATVLARLVAERGPTAALPAYEAARLRRCARMQAGARRQIRIDHLSGPAAVARNAALALAPEAALIRGLDWIYGWRDAA
ncbi:FAD-dependent monooxygenase [Chelatococcus sambhunathii]|uniref:FAD-dependent monooxygenase n=1 Tax=Chelatococcus sambhunathii TaxID=363953 RepID=A0ABU1DBP2_9HYPH|nr:FAD-dependent monooxygenase [Chelatococcus sambhunathii]MDR4305529.1 FAD-dependent monooxygenase [Chelatococcus sambhunathii]